MTRPTAVVELVAECELVPVDDYSGSPGGTSFTVVEYAVLSDGRRVTLLDDRGWTQWSPGAAEAPPLRADNIQRNVLNVVLPDDAEETGQEHEWLVFVERLAAAGIEITDEDLRRLPYRIELGDHLSASLSAG